MKKIFTLFIMSLLFMVGMAQQPVLEWAKNYGGYSRDMAFSVAVDNNGNVYSAGYIMDTADFKIGSEKIRIATDGGSADIIVTKQDAQGNFIWAKSMGGSAGEQAFSCKADASGNVYVTGTFMETVDFDPGTGVSELTSLGGHDIFILKLNADGDFVWAKQVGGKGDADYGQYLALDPADGSIYITGMFQDAIDFNPGTGVFNLYPNYPGDYDTYVLKLDKDGNFVWAISFIGDQFDTGTSLAADGQGNLFVCGVFGGKCDFDPGIGEHIIDSYSYGYADGFVCKLNAANGSLVWVIQEGNEGQDWCNGIAVDPSGNVLVTGSFLLDVDFDPGLNDLILSSQQMDAFVWKLDTDGKLVWAKNFTGPDFGWGSSIAVDASGNAYTTGYFIATCDFDPGEGVHNITAGAQWETYISKLTSQGDFAWAMAFKGNVYYDLNVDKGESIAVDAQNNVYTSGSFESWVDVDPSSKIFYITAHDVPRTSFYSEDAFVHKLSQLNVGLPEQADVKAFKLYPNPVKDVATIDLGSEYSYIEANVIDVAGKTLITKIFSSTSSIKVPMDIAKGIYFLQFRDKNGVISNLKVVKE